VLPGGSVLRYKASGVAAGMDLGTDSALFDSDAHHLAVMSAATRPAVHSGRAIDSAGAQALKRAVDLLAAVALLIFGTPLCVLVGLAIRLEDGGPILFRQTRVGRGGALFTLYKLRSMRSDAEADSGPQWAAPDDARVTRIGRWIRALRIDEIPQAWNVLVGDMSFVGPRPERPEFVCLLREAIPAYDHRHRVRPGMTGWVQLNQPSSHTIDDARRKLEYDLHYLASWSLLLDLYILARTATIILFDWGHRASAPQ